MSPRAPTRSRYSIRLAPRAQKQLRALPMKNAVRLTSELYRLAEQLPQAPWPSTQQSVYAEDLTALCEIDHEDGALIVLHVAAKGQ